MTPTCQLSAAVQPDSLTGVIMAIEGICDAAVLLNGPTGCKFFHGAIAEGQLPRESAYDPLLHLDEFYFGQPRVPATYLDGDDYVLGAGAKLERILPAVASKGHALIGVVNSPGAALIGDDLARLVREAGLGVPCVTIESTADSGHFDEGAGRATRAVLEALNPLAQPVEPRAVLLSGLNIAQRFWEGDVDELRRLLGLCGVEVVAVLTAGVRVDELRAIRRAAINIIVHEPSPDLLAPWLRERFGLETLVPSHGAPVGFDATEAWVRGVCARLGACPDPAIAAIDAARARAVRHIKRVNALTGLPKGATFAVSGSPSLVDPLVRWLREYLGMVPVAVHLHDHESARARVLADFLERHGHAGVMGRDALDAAPDLVFGDGAFLARFAFEPQYPAPIELELPSGGRIDVVPRCVLGARGALYLLESVLNGLVSIPAAQRPTAGDGDPSTAPTEAKAL
jgi:nitrogenase molybdenum-iron protein alpha/beta subunit